MLNRHLSKVATVALVLCLLWSPTDVAAIPSAPAVVCEKWPDIHDCQGAMPQCSMCHTTTSGQVGWNTFGYQFFGADTSGCSGENRWACIRDCFDPHLRAQLDAIAAAPGDSDGDCVDDVTELLLGTDPVDADEHPWAPFVPADPAGEENSYYAVGAHDWRFAYRRVKATFCGLSPTYDEVQALEAMSGTERQIATHEALDTCLSSAYWLLLALPRMADARIRPIKEVSADGSGQVARLGDYNDDYLLFSWALSGDHDARELLLADHHVRLNPSSTVPGDVLLPYDGPGPGPSPSQPLDKAHRAGMITTQWFMIVNTMFSEVPRTSAAHAMRSYLGMDIAKSEGMDPIAGEPLDVDNKGVEAEPCSHCHSTLDPLSYAFAEYEGIALGGGDNGSYDPARADAIFEAAGLSDAERPLPALFGETIAWEQSTGSPLVAWAELAANSDAFKRTIASMLFTYALGRDPAPDEAAEFTDWWTQWGLDDGYSANELLHDLIDLQAFGAP
jgi:hypothetical protein